MKGMKKRLIWAVLAALLAFGIVACQKTQPNPGPTPEPTPDPAPATRIVHDMMGNDVEIPAVVEKIAIATPVHTIFAMASGSQDKLVASPLTLNDFTLAVFPELGNLAPNPFANKGANIEQLLTLKPDVVVLADGISYIDAVKEMGFPVVLIDHYDFDSLLASIQTIGDVAGEAESDKAKEFVGYFHGIEALIAERLANVPAEGRTKVCYLWGTGSDLTSYGDQTVQHALLTAAGGDNVFAYLGSYKGISLEDVIAAAPEVIICSRKADWKEFTTAEEWKDIPAVANGRVYYAPKGFNGYVAVAPEIALGLVWATTCLYPDEMAGIDFRLMIRDFYSRFMGYDVTQEQIDKILAAEY